MNKGLLETAFKIMLENSGDMIFLKDADLVYRAVSLPFVKMVGKTAAEEIVGRRDRDIFAEKHLAERYELDDHKMMEKGMDLRDYVEPITDEDGHPRYGLTSKYLIRGEAGEIVGILGITRDVTMEYMARQHYQQEIRYLFNLPEDTYAVCYIDVDDWRVIKQRRQQIEDATLQAGQTVEEICEYAVESIVDRANAAVEFYENFSPEGLWALYADGKNRLGFEYERRLSENVTRWVRNEVNFLTDMDNGHLCVMLSAKDIHAGKLEEQKLLDAARLDRMTMVYNRETAMETIRSILEQESDRRHALLMLDVDNFKALNDNMGHQAGDGFLVKLADRLKRAFRDTDVIGRIGGDEFFVFLRDVTELIQVEKKAEELLNIVMEVSKEYLLVEVSGSVGISMYPENGKTLERLYARADAALYKAKHLGKNRYMAAD